MTPAARIQAAIEILDGVFAGTPAEKELTSWARRSRFAGSKDRAAVRDHVFDALRARDTCAAVLQRNGAGRDDDGACSEMTGRSVMIGLIALQGLEHAMLFSGVGHGPAALSDQESDAIQRVSESLEGHLSAGSIAVGVKTSEDLVVQSTSTAPFSNSRAKDLVPHLANVMHDETKDGWRWDMPDWCVEKLKSSHAENAAGIAALLKDRAPVDLRVNLARIERAKAKEALLREGIQVEPLALTRTALRVTEGQRKIKSSEAYQNGLIELQDAGSQALVHALPLDTLPNSARILDYCAGGGGKSLAIAGATGEKVFAHDVDVARMRDIPIRAKRAGANIMCRSSQDLQSETPFDLVLCDAPCSGSGAWRRSPDAKWRISKDRFKGLLAIQAEILDTAGAFVSRSGVLAYATCSLFAQENEDQVNSFLVRSGEFELISQHYWTPLDGCDGFFVSTLRRVKST